MFLLTFTASNLYCLQEPAEDHKCDNQAPNQTFFPGILWEKDVTLTLLYHQVANIILAETNVETFNAFIGYIFLGYPLLQAVFGDFGCFLLVESDFRQFQVVCCFSSYTNVTAYRRVNSSPHSSFLFKVKQQEKYYCCLVTQPSEKK